MSRRPELFLPPRKRWPGWAIALSLALHALLLVVRVRPWLPPVQLPPLVIVLPPASEGSETAALKFEAPGGAALKGHAAGITPRVEAAMPIPETPRVVEAIPPPIAAPLPLQPAPSPQPLVACDTCGPGRYRIGPARGEGKLWVKPLPAAPREIAEALSKTHIQLVDSAVAAIVQAFVDSVLNAPSAPGAAPPSWTTQIFGKTFGIDSKYIYLGGLKIPSAVLALLPIKSGGTTMEYSQSLRLAAIREDLATASQRAQTMEDFKRAVKELRAERERRHQLEQNQKKKPEQPDSARRP
ncbi:MAG TPA: hypothetical protein VGP61_05985 [Gemmatimonadales bacterium]|nr:hypothetical protein [Gemmatimonadales bacterium]